MGMTTFRSLIFFGSLLSILSEEAGGNLRSSSNQADYIIITPHSYQVLAEKLAAFRRQKNGFSVTVVTTDSIMAQFGRSVSPDTSLKVFIQFTLSSWHDPKPQYFLLAGNINAVPSHPEQEIMDNSGSSCVDSILMIDQWFVQVVGIDGVERMNACIARLPAWDSTSLSIMIDKTIEYETDSTGSWQNRAISLSDYSEADGDIFEHDSKYLQTFLDSLWTDTVSVHICCESCCHLCSTQFLELWNRGASIVTYMGHAKQTQLSATQFFTTCSIDSLTNGSRLPVCLLGGCDLTFDTGPARSIPTHLLERQAGGAVAVISCEGLMYEAETVLFFRSVIQSMIKNPHTPIGESFEAAMPGLVGDICKRFTFLGDPALTVRISTSGTFVLPPVETPRALTLEQNFPNPFNPSTVISYQLSAISHVTLRVYDVLGRFVAALVDEKQNPGEHFSTFDGSRLPSGIYFYRIQAGSYTSVKKMILMK